MATGFSAIFSCVQSFKKNLSDGGYLDTDSFRADGLGIGLGGPLGGWISDS